MCRDRQPWERQIEMTSEEKRASSSWTFLTNHAHVLLCLAGSDAMRIRDLAAAVGITERAVQRILSELTECGYLERTRDGRTNTYKIDTSKQLKHPIESHRRISDLVELIYGGAREAVSATTTSHLEMGVSAESGRP